MLKINYLVCMVRGHSLSGAGGNEIWNLKALSVGSSTISM